MEMTSSPFLFKDRRACGVIVNVSVTSKGSSERGLDALNNGHSRLTRNPIHVVRSTLKPIAYRYVFSREKSAFKRCKRMSPGTRFRYKVAKKALRMIEMASFDARAIKQKSNIWIVRTKPTILILIPDL
jgi:hypothetical protein